jgi:hypothetical protein
MQPLYDGHGVSPHVPVTRADSSSPSWQMLTAD